MVEFLSGKKTYIGLIVALAGALGVFKYFSEGNLTITLNTIAEIAGLLFAAYGRYKAKPKQ